MMMELLANETGGAFLQLILFALLPFVWWLCTKVDKENFITWLGLKKPKANKNIFFILAVTVGATLLYGISMMNIIRLLPPGITNAGSYFVGKGREALPAVLIYGIIRTGLSEEILFRGFLLKRVANKYGFIAGNTVQALIFGLLHGIPFGMITGSLLTLLLCTFLPGLFGWFEGWLNEKYFNGSIIPSWFLHGIINVISASFGL